jgi:hypothetical protein
MAPALLMPVAAEKLRFRDAGGDTLLKTPPEYKKNW